MNVAQVGRSIDGGGKFQSWQHCVAGAERCTFFTQGEKGPPLIWPLLLHHLLRCLVWMVGLGTRQALANLSSDRLGDYDMHCALQVERIARHNASPPSPLRSSSYAGSIHRRLLSAARGRTVDILIPGWARCGPGPSPRFTIQRSSNLPRPRLQWSWQALVGKVLGVQAVAWVKKLRSSVARHRGRRRNAALCNKGRPHDQAAFGNEIIWWGRRFMPIWWSTPVLYYESFAYPWLNAVLFPLRYWDCYRPQPELHYQKKRLKFTCLSYLWFKTFNEYNQMRILLTRSPELFSPRSISPDSKMGEQDSDNMTCVPGPVRCHF